MSEETVDYEAVCSRLIAENERLKQVLSAKYVPLFRIGERLVSLKEFIEDNYLVLMFLLFIGSAVCGGIYTVIQDRRGKHE